MKDQKVFDGVMMKHNLVKMAAEERGYQFVLMTSLVGSQNYGLETPTSDIDTYSYVLPNYLDFIRGDKPISFEIELKDGSKACVKDVRLALNLLRKPSPNSIECFLSDYKIYDENFCGVFEEYLKHSAMAQYLVHANYKNMVDASVGAIIGLHGRNMTEGKKLAHAIRIRETLYKYLNPQEDAFNYLHLQGEQLKLARQAKNGEIPIDVEQILYKGIVEEIINFGHNYQTTEQEKSFEYLANYDINRFEYKLFDVYFALNGLRRMYDAQINF